MIDKEDMVYTYNGIWLGHKKNEIMPLAAMWMCLEIIILSEVHQTEKDKYHMWCHLYVESRKQYKLIYWQKRNRLTDTEANMWLSKEKGGEG